MRGGLLVAAQHALVEDDVAHIHQTLHDFLKVH